MTIKTAENINLIWKHKHNDFKGVAHGIKTVMYPAPHSCLGRIEDMPDQMFKEELRWAQYREAKQVAEQKLTPIMRKHGLLEHFQGTNQWRETLDDVITYAGFALEGDKLSKLKEELLSANISFAGSFKFS